MSVNAEKSIEEAKESYRDVVARIKKTEAEYQNLVKRLDDMESEKASLNAKVESCEGEERSVYDSYFLGKASDKDLNDIRRKVQAAKEAIGTHSRMIESLNRCITEKEREIAGLRKQVDLLRHQVWASLFAAKSAAIPETVREAVRELICIGLNCSMGRDFVLPKIFPLPNSTETQTIYKKLSSDLGIE